MNLKNLGVWLSFIITTPIIVSVVISEIEKKKKSFNLIVIVTLLLLEAFWMQFIECRFTAADMYTKARGDTALEWTT